MFNNFGHNVCVCKPETFFLKNALSIQDGTQQCFKETDKGPCLNEALLGLSTEKYGTLVCSDVHEVAVNSIDPSPQSFKCDSHQVYAFGSGRSARTRGNG